MKYTLKKITDYALLLICLAVITAVAPVSKVGAQSNIVATINFDPAKDSFSFANFGNENRDWKKDISVEDMIRFFGTKAVCKLLPDNKGVSPDNCVLNAAAAQWLEKELIGMNEGHCEGMATTAALFKGGKKFKSKDLKPEDVQSGAKSVFDLKLTPEVANYVTYYALTQLFQEFASKRIDGSPVDVVKKLIEGMNAKQDTYTIGVSKYDPNTKKLSEGHAVTPIAVEETTDKFIVKVYDNNYPGVIQEITIEKTGKQAWKYKTTTKPGVEPSEYSGDSTTDSFSVSPNSAREGACFDAPFAKNLCPGAPSSIFNKPVLSSKIFSGADEFFTTNNDQSPIPATIDANSEESAEFSLNGAGDLLVVAPDGKRLGFDPQSNRFYKEINGAFVNPYVGGLGNNHAHYLVPANSSGNAYKVVFSGKELKKESRTDFIYSAPGLTVGFDGIQLDPNETLVTTITPDGETITFTSSADGETPGIYFAFDPKVGSGASYLIRVSGAQIDAGKTMTAHFDFDKHTVNFKDNDGHSDTYNVEVEKINPDGTRQTIRKELKEENGEVEGNLDEWEN